MRLRVLLLVGSIGLMAGALGSAGNAAALPEGSYQKSCKDCVDDGSMLRCQCSYKGKFSGTGLAYGLCEPGSIGNDKSKLTCTPRGSFRRTCKHISWNETRLQATCNPKKGAAKGAVLPNWPGCSEDIANCNGVLTCGPCR